MTLFPHIPVDPAETHLSFASRLAAIHAGERAGGFLSDQGIRLDRFVRGHQDAIEALCARAGVDPQPLLANTPIPLGERRYVLRSEVVSPDFLNNALIVFCPICLTEDDAVGADPARVRREHFIWKLRVVRTCPHHGAPLIVRPRKGWFERLNGFAISVPEHGNALLALSQAAPHRSVSPLQAYALNRLDGREGPAWLDSQTLKQSVRTSEMLGAFVSFGAKAPIGSFTPDQWDQAGRIGFALTSRGEHGIREGLNQLQEFLTKIGRRPQHRNAFGQLHSWLADEDAAKDPGDIRRIVREHIFDTVAIESGRMVLGGCLDQRRLHTVRSLAEEYNLDARTLHHVLAAKGLITLDDSTGTLDAALGREVAASITRMVHVISLPKALNCGRPQATALIDERILPIIATGQAGAPGRTQKAIDQTSIDGFLANLTAAAVIVGEVPSGMVPITKAAEKAKLLAIEVVQLLLGGFLTRIAYLSSDWGYAAVHVDPVEIGQVKQEVLIGISVSKAAAIATVPAQVIWALADLEDGSVLPVTRIAPRNGDRAIYRISPEHVVEFRRRYLKQSDIAEHLECAVKDAERRLRVVRTAFPEKQIGMKLYRVEDLPAALRPHATAA